MGDASSPKFFHRLSRCPFPGGGAGDPNSIGPLDRAQGRFPRPSPSANLVGNRERVISRVQSPPGFPACNSMRQHAACFAETLALHGRPEIQPLASQNASVWPSQITRRPRPFSQGLAYRRLCMGRAGRRRAVLLVLRSGGDIQGAGGQHPPEPVRRDGVRHHDRRDLRELFANHRALPLRRRRLSCRKQAPVPDGGGRLGQRSPRRLRAHGHDFRREWRRCPVQPFPRILAALEAPL